MSSSRFTLTGTENLKQIFKEFPEGGYRKPINAAFRKAAAPVKAAMISNLPTNLKGLSKSIKLKSSRASKGEPSLAVGVFSNGTYRNKRGIDWNPWIIAEWSNYGTMANRYSGHSFKTPRRSKTSDSKGGIKPQLFIEKAWDQTASQAQGIFEETVDKEITKFFEQRAAK